MRGFATYQDMSQADVDDVASKLPPGNIFPSGSDLKTRRNAVQWDRLEYRVRSTRWNPGNIGANVDDLEVGLGLVQEVQIRPGQTQLEFNYRAPDEAVCAVEVLNGQNWNRTLDMGGARRRTVTITGLTSSTAYPYRILCRYLQPVELEYLPSQKTHGTVSTSGTLARNVKVAAPLSTIAGAAKMRVTLTPMAGGSPVQQTCTSSPCQVTVAGGGMYRSQVEFLDAQNVVLRQPDTGITSVP